MSLLLLLYCPSFFLFLFGTAHQALVYTRGSRLISISLLLLLNDLTQYSRRPRLLGPWVVTQTSRSAPKGQTTGWLVHCCFEASQPLKITSGLKETFIKRYTVGRTNKAEIRLEEQSQKTEICRENLWKEMRLKGP